MNKALGALVCSVEGCGRPVVFVVPDGGGYFCEKHVPRCHVCGRPAVNHCSNCRLFFCSEHSGHKEGAVEDLDLDELWESTDGTVTCVRCDSPLVCGHIKKIRDGFAYVEWVCEECGFEWCSRCPFEDGCLEAELDEPDMMIIDSDSDDDGLLKCSVCDCVRPALYVDLSDKVLCRFHAQFGVRASTW